MYKDPFERLNVNRNCTQSELFNAFSELKSQYERERFMEGDAGYNAAKSLDEINLAYDEALLDLSNSYSINEGKSIFANVEDYIKSGKLDEAQKLLDSIHERGGEWHYIQAIIFYKKNWLLESRNQLTLALQLEPHNQKYLDTQKRLEAEIYSKNPFTNIGNEHGNERTYSDPQGKTVNTANSASCCNTCQTLICIDCCCECFGGDCISCC